jgi:hypothetical protein
VPLFIFMDTVARWHPWLDKPGLRHSLALNLSFSSAEEAIEVVAGERLYFFCSDPLMEFAYSDDLLRHPKSETYMQKRGKVVAVRVKLGRNSGFFIPARTWGYAYPSEEMIENIRAIFELFGYEAITAGSLSEKIARSTMDEHIYIYRPSCDLRSVLLKYNGGGRIDLMEEGRFFNSVRRYDINKAYLYFSQLVPDPFHPPKYHINPKEIILDIYATGYWEVTMVAHGSGIQPIYLDHKIPEEGQTFRTWLWTAEIRACLRKGHTLSYIHKGYGWYELSNLFAPWADILWAKFQQTSEEPMRDIIKSMMVSFPGRCLKEPMNYLLVPRGEAKKGDVPIAANWWSHLDNWEDVEPGRKFLTNWYLRAEYNEESTALTPVGAYIIMKCRQAVYEAALLEEARGNKLLQAYIDCLVFEREATTLDIGNLPGQFKTEEFTRVWLEMNRFVGEGQNGAEMNAPGVEKKDKNGYVSEERLELWRKYRELLRNRKYC